MRDALDEVARELGRYVQLTNYSSRPVHAGDRLRWPRLERLDMLLNDAMYGILFRDINMGGRSCDQRFSRRSARAGIIINTGEDNYITTADAGRRRAHGDREPADQRGLRASTPA